MLSVKTVAVIGAGTLGRALALQAAEAGFTTVLEDVLPSNLRAARAGAGAAPCGEMLHSRLRYAQRIEDAVRDADLILDSVPDELESKLEILSLLDRMAPPRSICMTPTRVLSIADLASCTYRPERCVSFAFADGTAEMPARGGDLRILHTSRTLPAVMAAVEEFWVRLGFQPELALDPLESAEVPGPGVAGQ